MRQCGIKMALNKLLKKMRFDVYFGGFLVSNKKSHTQIHTQNKKGINPNWLTP
jgi:hypothetical protein